jgi:hypothetical protein
VPVDTDVIDIISRIYSTPQTGDISIHHSTESRSDNFENELSVHNQTDAAIDLSKGELSEPDEVNQYVEVNDANDNVHNDDEQKMLTHPHLSNLLISAGLSSTKRPPYLHLYFKIRF